MYHVASEHSIGIKRACKICGLGQSSYYYKAKNKSDDEIKKKLQEMAAAHSRWGFDMMMSVLRNEKCKWNHKRVYRVYCELKLNLRVKPKKRIPSRKKKSLIQPLIPNLCWSIDFMSDALCCNRRFRTFNVIDDYNRECLGIKASLSLPAISVTTYLDEIAEIRGYPNIIRTDNGPEFISNHFRLWADSHGVFIQHIEPGKPAQNGYIERFNRTYRGDILDAHLFDSIREVQRITDPWIEDYNNNRPHGSLGGKPPIEFARARDACIQASLAKTGAVAQEQQN